MQHRIVVGILPFPPVPRFLSLVLYASSSVRVSEHLRLPYCLSGIFQLLNQTSLPGKFLNRI
jgi:hypothetical protein